jgi:tetratricopeptide (TPR) repeat protein
MKRTALLIFSIILLVSCNKDNLNAKPDSTQIVPETVDYYQRILDNQNFFNYTVFLGEVGADNYYVPENLWENLNIVCRSSYIWAQKPFEKETVNDWDLSFATIYNANTVLEGINGLPVERDSPGAINAMGQAYFHRAHALFQLAQLFCKVYDPVTATTDLGIPLRLQSDVMKRVSRSTVQETYDQIIADLVKAEELLPVNTAYKTRPGKLAATALLARVYLSMSVFEKAFQYADKALAQNNVLMDYNTIPNTGLPFKQYNNEVIWHMVMGGSTIFNANNNCPVDTLLYRSYDDNDLRKVLYFGTGSNNRIYFKGTYAGLSTSFKFCGLSIDELYITRAECYAQKGMLTEAMNDLDSLMVKRWKNNGTFKPFQATTKEAALQLILNERRKELIFRGTRWTDLRRLNRNGAGITISRVIKGDTIPLLPNSLRYVYPIPDQELEFNPMPQNER